MPSNSMELLELLLMEDSPVDYMGKLFEKADDKMDSRLRAMMCDLKEKGYLTSYPAYIKPQMAQLEEELFIRGKHLTLTDAGVMLRRRAEEVVNLMNKIESEFEEQNEVGGIISIGSGGLSAVEFLLPAMQSFCEKYPKV